jgi:Tfp pilus assembly protein PilF
MSQEVMDNYEHLEKIFMEAVEANNGGRTEQAEKLFKDVLAEEPRMTEPRLELASIYLRRGQLEEAEEQAREALHYLERGWKWLEELTDDQMLAHACNLLGEILKQQSTSDDVMRQGDGAIRQRWQEAGELFERAAELDPENPDVMSNYFGFKKQRVPRAPLQSRPSGR